MNIQRFTAPTSREALAKARAVFGEGTLILSNRPVAGGVEVVATAEDALAALAPPEAEAAPAKVAPRGGAAKARPAAPPAAAAAPTPEQQDAEQLAMSTLSFQDYVRERMLRRRHEAVQAAQEQQQQALDAAQAMLAPRLAASVQAAAPAHKPAVAAASATVASATDREVLEPLPEIRFPVEEIRPALAADAMAQPAAQPAMHAVPQTVPVQVAPAQTAPLQMTSVQSAAPQAAPVDIAPAQALAAGPVVAPAPAAPAASTQGIVQELQAMKALIDDRFNTLAWLGETRQDPIRASLMHKLIRAGYSPTLSRTLLEHLPEGGSAADSLRWLTATLERNLRTDAPGHRMLEEGGVFALVGATGVGKTTTVAKLAGLAVREHGSAGVGLITLDTQRVGGHEQLRTFGRQIGVVAHQAHDRAALAELLGLFENRHLVLIDTAGVAPSDPRMKGMLDMLDLPGVNRTLVLNAGSHGDTLDSVLSAFRGTGTQHAVLSKLDEAVKLGPALDTLIRHQFTLRGVTDGQRVPDDWKNADAAELVRQSMRAPARSAFDPKPADLGFFFAAGQAGTADEAALAA